MNRLSSAGALILAALLPGCLLVRTTEHLIRLNPDGSGEAILRLYDIRSDGRTDSAVIADVSRLVSTLNGGERLFEQNTRKLLGKQVMVQGDTFSLEIRYSFGRLDAVEGIRANADELFLAVGPDNEIVRTNGEVERWVEDLHRIVWPREATRLSYRIRERSPRASTSIVRWYRELSR